MQRNLNEPQRRRYPRHRIQEPVKLALGGREVAFGRTRDVSRAGTCVLPSAEIQVRVGDGIVLTAPPFGARRARVVAISTAGTHCAFDD